MPIRPDLRRNVDTCADFCAGDILVIDWLFVGIAGIKWLKECGQPAGGMRLSNNMRTLLKVNKEVDGQA